MAFTVSNMKPKLPTIIEENESREPAQAKWWRINIARLTVAELADLTGYSTLAIYLMERGVTSSGTLIKPWPWRRYKVACAGVEQQLLHGLRFEWRRTPEQLRKPVQQT